MLVHAFTEMLLTKTVFAKNFYTYRCFYPGMLSQRGLPLRAGAFKQGCFYTEELSHADTQVLLHTDAFTPCAKLELVAAVAMKVGRCSCHNTQFVFEIRTTPRG
jgi:hypothetical protein